MFSGKKLQLFTVIKKNMQIDLCTYACVRRKRRNVAEAAKWKRLRLAQGQVDVTMGAKGNGRGNQHPNHDLQLHMRIHT